MKLTLKAKEQTFKDFVLESASKQIELLKSDIDTFKKMYHSEMTPRETMYLDEAIAEKKKQLSNQQALLRKYQKIRSSATAEEIKAAKLIGYNVDFDTIDGGINAFVDLNEKRMYMQVNLYSDGKAAYERTDDKRPFNTEWQAINNELRAIVKKSADALDKDIAKFVKKYKLKRV
jgi:hypothetical protein